MNQIGAYIKRLRDRRGWSRAELARVSKVPYTTLAHIERAKTPVKPTEETLKLLAEALESDADDTQMRILSGYDVRFSEGVSERAKRIDALLTVAPRWGVALLEIQELREDEQDQALSVLEAHLEVVKRRKRARLN